MPPTFTTMPPRPTVAAGTVEQTDKKGFVEVLGMVAHETTGEIGSPTGCSNPLDLGRNRFGSPPPPPSFPHEPAALFTAAEIGEATVT
jgi:hypothetical protein